ncbi:hypothetical protein GIB67_035689 [Kingdonia uniflora]|uniref:Uncharacterized protein n=1 Tax=Kingdonia uniflora TaxID=39325 RepID=A0A7J7MIW8_9MAGN|nr:hypothetical protein GIB67_035689 [Kingdonia uniflora]
MVTDDQEIDHCVLKFYELILRKSCRLRWFNQLDPKINKRAFIKEEEEKLLRAHRVYRNKWAMIARLYPGSTDNAVKSHCHVVDARKQRENASSTNNVYKRRKPFTRPEILSAQHTSTIACSHESTITSAKDESNSICTDLSLNSFSKKAQSELQPEFFVPLYSSIKKGKLK